MNNLLAADHTELDALLRELFAALDGDDAKFVYQKLDLFWARLAMHIRAEHLHLFPALLNAVKTLKPAGKNTPSLESVESKIARLKHDHDFFMCELAEAVKQIRELMKGNQEETKNQLSSVREKIFDVSQRLQTHNQTEETQVYLWAESLLDSAERADLDKQIQKEMENLPPRFGKLNDRKSQNPL